MQQIEIPSPESVSSYFYAIYDVKAHQIFQGLLRVLPSDGAAERWFSDMMCLDDCPINRYPTDFTLVRVGVINNDTLHARTYGVGFTEPVITGQALMRRLQAPPPAPPEPPSDQPQPSA